MTPMLFDHSEYPDCEDCETDLFVEKHRSNGETVHHCHFCGWRSDE